MSFGICSEFHAETRTTARVRGIALDVAIGSATTRTRIFPDRPEAAGSLRVGGEMSAPDH